MKIFTRLITLVIILCLVFTGCSTKSDTLPQPEDTSSQPEDTDTSSVDSASESSVQKEADIVVVGGGMAGLSAAIEAAEGGAKVILLEKLSFLGGNTNVAEGVFAVGSVKQQELGIDADINKILPIEYNFQNYKVNSKLWEMIADNSADNIKWMLDMGIQFATVTAPGNFEKTWHVYAPVGDYKHGAAPISVMKGKAESLGIEILLSTEGNKLIMDAGKVSGINALAKDGSKLDIKCDAVILATGGFGANNTMVMEKSTMDFSQLYHRGVPSVTGDGIRMATEVGAYADPNITVCALGVTLAGAGLDSQINTAAAMEPVNLWVNEEAERYVHEDISMHFTNASNALLSQNKTFTVFDSDQLNRLAEEGCIMGYGVFLMPGTKLTSLEDEIDKALTNDNIKVFKADTIEGLAEQMGLDSSTFTDTVNTYNQYCVNGQDLQYGKDPAFLKAVKTAPFYGFQIVANNLNTLGGLRINTRCEVLNEEKTPISGLYAAGMDVSGFSGETYGIIIPGSTQAIALGTGRISAKNALNYIGKMN